MTAKITFYGGVGTVTGANFLLDTGSQKILVDCGIVQRENVCDAANSLPFPYDPKTIDALIVTHAHADHIGRIPKLVRDGFRGPIHSTAATKDLASLMFDDAIGIMRYEAAHHGCALLYEKEDGELARSLWRGHEYHEPFTIGDISIEFLDAGHILGSAMVRIKRGSKSILFTGDLGNSPEPLLNDTELPEGTNYLVMESVYGDRLHEHKEARQHLLRDAVLDARNRNSTLLIPSFSLERTQILLYELNSMVERGKLDPVQVYLDSPLAIEVTAIYRSYQKLFNPEVRKHFAHGDDPFIFKNLKLTPHIETSNTIHDAPNPKIIIAGAGMAAGGRIRSHLKRYAPDPHAVILFVGYQAPGSLGRRILEGDTKVDIDGAYVNVRAGIGSITGYSGHADRDQLLTFVENAGETLERVFVTMGEPRSSLFLAQRIQDFLGVDAVVPEQGQSCDIDW